MNRVEPVDTSQAALARKAASASPASGLRLSRRSVTASSTNSAESIPDSPRYRSIPGRNQILAETANADPATAARSLFLEIRASQRAASTRNASESQSR